MTSKNDFKPVTHVIFDMDGLILDTEKYYTIANQKFLDKFGVGQQEFTWDVKQKMMGRKSEETAKILFDHYKFREPVTIEQYLEECQQCVVDLHPNAELMPGAERLIWHLATNQVPICICTGSTTFNFNLKIARHQQLFELFNHVVCSPDDPEVVHGKPHPDCFLVGAKRFQPKPDHPESVLVFEDSVNGVEAALKAGMQVVMVPDQRIPEKDRKHATLCLNSLIEFQPELFNLPPFN